MSDPGRDALDESVDEGFSARLRPSGSAVLCMRGTGPDESEPRITATLAAGSILLDTDYGRWQHHLSHEEVVLFLQNL
jgi:hypothetical protein